MLQIKGKVNTDVCFASAVEDIIDYIDADSIEVLRPLINYKAS